VLRAGGGSAVDGVTGAAAPARGALVRLDVGVFGDRAGERSVRTGLFGSVVDVGRNLPRRPAGVPASFRANRGVDEGDYVRSALTVDLHPDIGAEFVRPGVGARLHWERADGGPFARGLTYQRGEARLMGRRGWGLPWRGALTGSELVLVGRGDAGAVWSAAPPSQQLFELGSNQNLPGYGYKEFAGDRAWVARGYVLAQSPWLRAPLRLRVLGRPLVFPGLAPGLSVGAQAGQAEASDDAARAAVLRLGTLPDPATGLLVPLSRPTDGVRATMNVGVRFFGGAVFAGAARPLDRQVDRPGGWRWLLTLNQGL
jgi:hypothetical protein